MIKEIVSDIKNKNKILEFACLLQKDTGLNGCIYISIEQGQHNPRIKYCLKNCKKDCLTITINGDIIDKNNIIKKVNKKELKLVKQFVEENKELIKDYWFSYNEISTYQLLSDFINWFKSHKRS